MSHLKELQFKLTAPAKQIQPWVRFVPDSQFTTPTSFTTSPLLLWVGGFWPALVVIQAASACMQKG